MARYRINGRDCEASMSAGSVWVDGKELGLGVLSCEGDTVEFMLGGRYHRARYAGAGSSSLDLVIDGVPVSVELNPGMDEVVYKNAGGAARGGVPAALRSKIPGKVVSVSVSAGDEVAEGDAVCTLESMKMQVSVAAHRAGTVKSVKVSEGGNVAKGDVIAEIS